MSHQPTFDVAIIGSGIAGTTLACILAKQGKQVLLFEAKEHPRFAIGESMILETSEMMRAIAHFYDIPEIAYFSSENFRQNVGTSHGVKRHFGFWHHQQGKPHNATHTLQAVIPKEPHGHELHLYRQDSDHFMLKCAVKYGVTVQQNTQISDATFADDGVTLVDALGFQYRTDYLVDACGFRSLLAKRFNLRTQVQQTKSRAIFTHMIDVENVPRETSDLPFDMAEGTLHHVFDGGWLWVIPFDNFHGATNPVKSVGLLLDPDKYPQRNDVSPETEFFEFIERFPSIHQQLKSGKAIRDWTRAPRIQYGTTQVVGDRWALLGHAAGFIDPLYSKGLYVSMTSVFVLSHLLLTQTDYSREVFRPLETVTQNFLKTNDRLVANSYKSWEHYSLWQAYSALWLLGAYTEYVKLNSIRATHNEDRDAYVAALLTLKMSGGGYAEFDTVANQIDTIIEAVDTSSPLAVLEARHKIDAIFSDLPWMPGPFMALLDGATSLPRNKIRPDLLKKETGFLGSGNYRKHFFGDASLIDLGVSFMKERWRWQPQRAG